MHLYMMRDGGGRLCAERSGAACNAYTNAKKAGTDGRWIDGRSMHSYTFIKSGKVIVDLHI
jgi:hypothetical protein